MRISAEEYQAIAKKVRKPEKDWPDEYPGRLPTEKEIAGCVTLAWPPKLQEKINAASPLKPFPA